MENDACVGMLSDQCFFLTCTQAYFLPQYAKRILNRIYDLLGIDTLLVLQTSNYKEMPASQNAKKLIIYKIPEL